MNGFYNRREKKLLLDQSCHTVPNERLLQHFDFTDVASAVSETGDRSYLWTNSCWRYFMACRSVPFSQTGLIPHADRQHFFAPLTSIELIVRSMYSSFFSQIHRRFPRLAVFCENGVLIITHFRGAKIRNFRNIEEKRSWHRRKFIHFCFHFPEILRVAGG